MWNRPRSYISNTTKFYFVSTEHTSETSLQNYWCFTVSWLWRLTLWQDSMNICSFCRYYSGKIFSQSFWTSSLSLLLIMVNLKFECSTVISIIPVKTEILVFLCFTGLLFDIVFLAFWSFNGALSGFTFSDKQSFNFFFQNSLCSNDIWFLSYAKAKLWWFLYNICCPRTMNDPLFTIFSLQQQLTVSLINQFFLKMLKSFSFWYHDAQLTQK